MTVPVPAVIKAFLPSRRPQERKRRRMKHLACLEQYSRTHMITQEVVKTTDEDRNQEKATERRPTEMKATKQQTPKCWIKSFHPGLLGDTYIPQRLRKISLPEFQTRMIPVALEMRKRPESDVAFECPMSFCKGHGGRFITTTLLGPRTHLQCGLPSSPIKK